MFLICVCSVKRHLETLTLSQFRGRLGVMNFDGEIFAGIQNFGAVAGAELLLNASGVGISLTSTAESSLCNPGVVALNASGTIHISPGLVDDMQVVCALSCDDVDGLLEKAACRTTLRSRTVGELMTDIIGDEFRCQDIATDSFTFPLLDKIIEIPALQQAIASATGFDKSLVRLTVSSLLKTLPSAILQTIGRVLEWTGTDAGIYMRNLRVMATGVQADLWADVDVLNSAKSTVCDHWDDLMNRNLFLRVSIGDLLDKLGLGNLKTCPVRLIVQLVEGLFGGRRMMELHMEQGADLLPAGITGQGALLLPVPEGLASLGDVLHCSSVRGKCLSRNARAALQHVFSLATPHGREAAAAVLSQFVPAQMALPAPGRGLQAPSTLFALLDVSINLVNAIRGFLGDASKWPRFLKHDYPVTGSGVVTIGQVGPTCDAVARRMTVQFVGATPAQAQSNLPAVRQALAQWLVQQWGGGSAGMVVTQLRNIAAEETPPTTPSGAAAAATNSASARALQSSFQLSWDTVSGTGLSSGRVNQYVENGVQDGSLSLQVGSLQLASVAAAGDSTCEVQEGGVDTCGSPGEAAAAVGDAVAEEGGGDPANEGTAAAPRASGAAASSGPGSAGAWIGVSIVLICIVLVLVFLLLAKSDVLPASATPACLRSGDDTVVGSAVDSRNPLEDEPRSRSASATRRALPPARVGGGQDVRSSRIEIGQTPLVDQGSGNGNKFRNATEVKSARRGSVGRPSNRVARSGSVTQA